MKGPDIYRRERRRLRADAFLIARGVDRETRRKIWREYKRGFTSLARALRCYRYESVHTRAAGDALWFQVFAGWDKTPATIAWGRAVCRQGRKLANRCAQHARMALHQAEALR